MIITQMLNKIGSQNFEEYSQQLLKTFKDIYMQVPASDQVEFIRAIALRLVSRAKTCRATGHIFGKLFKGMS